MLHFLLYKQSKIGHKPQSDIGIILWEELNLATIPQELASHAGISLVQYPVIYELPTCCYIFRIFIFIFIFFWVNTVMSTNNEFLLKELLDI